MPLRKLLRGVLESVGKQVAQDDLFEKPGERAPSAKLPPSAPVIRDVVAAPVVAVAAPKPVEAAPKVEAKAPKKAKKTAAVEKPTQAVRPAEGCVPVDAAGLLAALLPAGKPLVVNHWATWCDPCVDELPRLVRAAAGVAGVGEFLGVSWDLFDHPGEPEKVARKVAGFADSVGVGYPSVLFTGEAKELFTLLNLDFELIPQTVVIAPDGKVTWHKKGVIDHDDVFPLIKAVKAAAGVG